MRYTRPTAIVGRTCAECGDPFLAVTRRGDVRVDAGEVCGDCLRYRDQTTIGDY